VPTSSACRDLLLIQQLNKQQILGMRSLSALLPLRPLMLNLCTVFDTLFQVSVSFTAVQVYVEVHTTSLVRVRM